MNQCKVYFQSKSHVVHDRCECNKFNLFPNLSRVSCSVVLTFGSTDGVTIKMEAYRQYFPVVLFQLCCSSSNFFGSRDEIPKCNQSNETELFMVHAVRAKH